MCFQTCLPWKAQNPGELETGSRVLAFRTKLLVRCVLFERKEAIVTRIAEAARREAVELALEPGAR